MNTPLPIEPLKIVYARETDIPVIQHIAEEALFPAYQDVIPMAQIQYDLEREYATPALLEQMHEKHHHFILLYQNTEAIGFASFSSQATEPQATYLHKLYLLPSLKGKGYGSYLMGFVEKVTQVEGYAGIALMVNRNNPSVTFYQKAGFEIRQELSTDIGQGFWRHDYLMFKHVSS